MEPKFGADDRLLYGLDAMQGWRRSMEDAHATVLDLQENESTKAPPEERVSYFGVFDGHRGGRVARYSGENVHKILAGQPTFKAKNYAQGLKDGFLATDRAILQDKSYKGELSGCTATVALVTSSRIYVANAGDSRTVLGTGGRAKPLSQDHKPQAEAEKERIRRAGGYVVMGRVNGMLAVSRAIGDFEFKRKTELPPEQQSITACPDVSEHDITADDEFLVLACDGIWDCASSERVIGFVRRSIAARQRLDTICQKMILKCMANVPNTRGIGCDNMTMIIIGLLQEKTPEEWYNMIATRVADSDRSYAGSPVYYYQKPVEFGKSGSIIVSGESTHESSDTEDDEKEDNEQQGDLAGSAESNNRNPDVVVGYQ